MDFESFGEDWLFPFMKIGFGAGLMGIGQGGAAATWMNWNAQQMAAEPVDAANAAAAAVPPPSVPAPGTTGPSTTGGQNSQKIDEMQSQMNQGSGTPDPLTASTTASNYIGMPNGYDPNTSWGATEGDPVRPVHHARGGRELESQGLYPKGENARIWNTFESAKQVVQAKRTLAAAGYYGKSEPIYSASIITQDDYDAMEEAMGDANRGGLPSWSIAASERERALAKGDGMTPAQRAEYRTAYHQSVDDLETFAFDNGIKMRNEDIARWAGKAARGDRSLEETKAHLTDKFISRMYPALKEDLKAGYTVREAAAPYLQTVADYIGDPNPSLHDPLVQKALQGMTDKGQPTLMPLWQFQQEAKKDKRYQYSDMAWQEEGDRFASIMSMFGIQP